MDLEKLLIKQFNQIKNVVFEQENNLQFLRVETKLNDLKAIEILSNQISEFLDQINFSQNKYYLDVFSSGIKISDTELEKLIKK